MRTQPNVSMRAQTTETSGKTSSRTSELTFEQTTARKTLFAFLLCAIASVATCTVAWPIKLQAASGPKTLQGAEFIFHATNPNGDVLARRILVSGGLRRFDFFRSPQAADEPLETILTDTQASQSWWLEYTTKKAYSNPKSQATDGTPKPVYKVRSEKRNVRCGAWICRELSIVDVANGLEYEARLSAKVPEQAALLIVQKEALAHMSAHHIQAHLAKKWPNEVLVSLESKLLSDSKENAKATSTAKANSGAGDRAAAVGLIRLISAAREKWPEELFRVPPEFTKTTSTPPTTGLIPSKQ